jgi:hypothetical protein
MRKLGEGGDGEGRGQTGGGEPEKPEKTLALFQRSPEGALFRSSALTTFSWLNHIFFLLLVDPMKYLDISRDRALAYSIIPLIAGVVFLWDAIYNFRRIEARSVFHTILLIFAIIFGGLSIVGLSGFVLRLVRRSYGI